MAREQRLHAEIRRNCPGHVPDEVHDCGASRNVIGQHAERVIAVRLEFLLDFHRNVGKREFAAQWRAIGTEFVRDTGQEKLNRHRRAPLATLGPAL